jgi:pre-mRNA-splicing factor 18
MDLLQKELERKRKAIELAKKQSNISIRASSIAGTKDSSSTATGDGTLLNGNTRVDKKRVYLKASELLRFQHEYEEAERLSAENNVKKRKQSHTDSKSAGDKKSDNNVHAALWHPSSTRRMDNHQWDDENVCKGLANNTNVEVMKGQSDNGCIEDKNLSEKTSIRSGYTTTMTSSQITLELRELGIPVRLFGEINDEQRLNRLEAAKEKKRSIMAGMSDIDDFKLGSGHGIRNPFLEKDNVNDELDKKRSVKQAPTTMQTQQTQHVQPSQSKSTLKAGTGTTGTCFESTCKTSNGDNDDSGSGALHEASMVEEIDVYSDPHKAIHRFFKLQLKQWEDDLVNRSEAVKRSLQGKNETKTLKQCKDYIRPLFKLCKNRRLEQSMTDHLVKIVKHCQEGEFVKANDAYMDVAIGRAAWPIGVTMVGIHARSGRSKIESNNVAHVMNSELQRKYLTSVKRLITYCQKKRTDVAPSKKVVNV